MRILMLDNEFPPLGGGTGVVNEHIMREMAKYADITVDLVTSSRTRSTYETVQFAPRSTIYKVPVDNQNIHHSSNIELVRYVWRGWQVSRRLQQQQPYDVCFAWAGVPAGAMAWALKQEFGLPYIVSLQGPDVPGFEARYNTIYPILTPLLRLVWRQAGVVTAISKQHQELAYRTLNSITIPVIANGAETDRFVPMPPTPRPITMLCVGRLIERKGQHYLLQAFARVRQQRPTVPMRLLLVGTGDSEASYRHLAQQLGLQDVVEFVGFVAREDMPDIYHRADIFVLPSQNEGMSIALLEALASGLPVIVTNTGGTDELVQAGVNGLIITWADVPGLVAAVLQLIDQPQLRASMGTASREVALRYSWAVITQKNLELLQQIVSK